MNKKIFNNTVLILFFAAIIFNTVTSCVLIVWMNPLVAIMSTWAISAPPTTKPSAAVPLTGDLADFKRRVSAAPAQCWGPAMGR